MTTLGCERLAAVGWDAECSYCNTLHEPCNDFGNADRLVNMFHADLKYMTHEQRWLVWDDNTSRWAVDIDDVVVERLAVVIVESLEFEASNCGHPTHRPALASHYERSQSRQSIEGMVRLARLDPRVSVDAIDIEYDRLCWQYRSN